MNTLLWKRSWTLRALLSNEVQTMSNSEIAGYILASFSFSTSPEGEEYWFAVLNGMRNNRIKLDDEIRTKLVAIMLMPAKMEKDI